MFNSGFAFDSAGRECGAAQVPPFICHIIVSDMHKTTWLAQQSMLNGPLGLTTIAGGKHIQQGMVVLEADVEPPFVHQQASTIQPNGIDREPCARGTVPFVPSHHGGIVPATAVKKDLLVNLLCNATDHTLPLASTHPIQKHLACHKLTSYLLLKDNIKGKRALIPLLMSLQLTPSAAFLAQASVAMLALQPAT